MSAKNRQSGRTEVGLGVHSQLYRNFTWPRALEGISLAGYEWVGIGHTHAGQPVIPPDAMSSQLATVRRQIDAAGLRPAVMYSSTGAARDYASLLRRTVEVAAKLGCPFVSSYGPSPYRDGMVGRRKRKMEYFLECNQYFAALRATAPLAASLGVTLTLKPHSGVTGRGHDLADIVRWLDLPNVRVNYDAGNILYFEGVAPEEDLPACAEHVRLLSIKDHRGAKGDDEVPIPGTGIVDHVALFRILFDEGFVGPGIVERIDGPKVAADIDAALVTARRNIEGAIASARSV